MNIGTAARKISSKNTPLRGRSRTAGQQTQKVALARPSNVKRRMGKGYRPTNLDVLCGRGKATLNHSGNKMFRNIVAEYLDTYSSANKKTLQKTLIIIEIVGRVIARGGYFLKQDKQTREWYEINNKLSREKVGHALRDALSDREIRQSLSSSSSLSSHTTNDHHHATPLPCPLTKEGDHAKTFCRCHGPSELQTTPTPSKLPHPPGEYDYSGSAEGAIGSSCSSSSSSSWDFLDQLDTLLEDDFPKGDDENKHNERLDGDADWLLLQGSSTEIEERKALSSYWL